MENQFGGFEEQPVGFGGFGGFGDTVEGAAATGELGTEIATTVKATAKATIGDIPFSQINGLQDGKYPSLEGAKEAIMSLDGAELQRRKENGLAFRWIKTIVDKIEWKTDAKGKRVLKSPKFLGWLVVTNDTNGTPTALTDAQLLSYITAHCPQSGKIGTGAEGLQLRHAVRKNRSSKGGNFPNSMVITLVPSEKGVYKYQEDKLEPAKAGVFEDDGITPVKVLKPGARKDSTNSADFIQKYDWVSEEYKALFGTRRSSKVQKKDKQSAEAFEILAYMQGLKDESIYM